MLTCSVRVKLPTLRRRATQDPRTLAQFAFSSESIAMFFQKGGAHEETEGHRGYKMELVRKCDNIRVVK